MHRSNNIVLKTLSGVNYYELLATCSKYSIDVTDMSKYYQADNMEGVLSHCRR